MSELNELFIKYGTDKQTSDIGWGYTGAYEEFLEHRRNEVRNVLEIGICGFRDIPNNVVGASLFAWRDYFPNASVFGIDNDGRFIFNDQPYIYTAQADAYDPVELDAALEKIVPANFRGFDFIVDDCVHDPLPQLMLCRTLWPLLRYGGVYAIEEACPYKCPGNKLDGMAHILLQMLPGVAGVREYTTHKDERLLILMKSSRL